MKITAIYGTEHVGSTVELARMAISYLHPQSVTEFFLPRDFDHYCSGCGACFTNETPCCVQAKAQIEPILQAIEQADILIFACPVYVYHVTGAMKSFLDHMGCRWMIHRPSGSMFQKRALLLTTAAGGGMRSTLKDLQDSMNFWGVGRVVRYGKAIRALYWKNVTPEMRAVLARDIAKACDKLHVNGPVKPRFTVRLLFGFFQKLQRRIKNPTDIAYWQAQGWLSGKKPW